METALSARRTSQHTQSKPARLLAGTKKFELKPDHCEPLPDKAFNKMQELTSLGSFTGFGSLAWDIVALGLYGGFRQQEYAMDHKTKVKYFNTPKRASRVRLYYQEYFIPR